MSSRSVVVVLLAFALSASGARADGIVLEAYTRDRPADAQRLLSPILDELTRANNMTAGDQLARQYETAVSKPSQTAQGLPGDFAAQVDRGFKAWIAGQFSDAIKILVPLVEAAHANSGELVKNKSLSDPLRKALVVLGLSQKRIGDQSAMEAAFVELIHSFTPVEVSRAEYGAEAHNDFEQVRRAVEAAGKGSLQIDVAQSNGAVFVDEQYNGQGAATLSLPPGNYRVVVLLDQRPSRTHYVTVRVNAPTRIAIDAELDQAIHTGGGWTGFSFATDAAREANSAPFAATFANAVGAHAVAVLSFEQVKGHAALVGALVSLGTGREIRRANVALDPDPSMDHLKALADYVIGKTDAVAGIEVEHPNETPPPSRDASTTAPIAAGAGSGGPPVAGGASEPPHDETPAGTGRWGGWKWLTAVGAVGGIGAGLYLAVENGACEKPAPSGGVCTNVYSYTPGQYISLAAGGLLAIGTVYLFATLSHEHASSSGNSSQRAAYVVPAPGGALAGYSFTW